eukprot:11209538-Lingulodinium_polyedra.AAC.1
MLARRRCPSGVQLARLARIREVAERLVEKPLEGLPVPRWPDEVAKRQVSYDREESGKAPPL